MKDRPLPGLLDRDRPQAFMRKEFAGALELLQELVDYGTNLLSRCLRSSDRRLCDIVILGSALKHVISQVEASRILLSHAHTYGARTTTRSLFEGCLALGWLLKDPPGHGTAYYVWQRRQLAKNLEGLLSGANGASAMGDMLEHIGGKMTPEIATQGDATARAGLMDIQRQLAKPEFAPTNAQFDALRQPYPKWFAVTEARSWRAIANELGYRVEYSVFYAEMSDVAHGYSFRSHVAFKDGAAIMEPILRVADAHLVIRWNMTLALRAYEAVLREYRPHELQNFGRKFVEEWQERFNAVPQVGESAEYHDI